jgi:hypothetical protein
MTNSCNIIANNAHMMRRSELRVCLPLQAASGYLTCSDLCAARNEVRVVYFGEWTP